MRSSGRGFAPIIRSTGRDSHDQRRSRGSEDCLKVRHSCSGRVLVLHAYQDDAADEQRGAGDAEYTDGVDGNA
jgi:hypothetical protein